MVSVVQQMKSLCLKRRCDECLFSPFSILLSDLESLFAILLVAVSVGVAITWTGG